MNSKRDETAIEYVPAAESDKVSRKLLAWFNKYKRFPGKIRRIDFEYLEDDKPCMALSTIQAAYKTTQYINGGYMAQYQFKIIYRAQPQGNDARLKMDEALDAFGAWAESQTKFPDIGAGLEMRYVSCDTKAGFFGRYEGGDEDHQIFMTMEYERKKGLNRFG